MSKTFQKRSRVKTAKPSSQSEGWNSLETGNDRSAERDVAFRRAIFAIPSGKVSTYGGVAAAAGYPRYHRFVARMLHQDNWDQLPWHRVVGADGAIKTSGASAKEQRARLRLEGVKFIGDRVDLKTFLLKPKRRNSDAYDAA